MVADDLSDLPNGWLLEGVLDDAAPLGARGPIGSPRVLTTDARRADVQVGARDGGMAKVRANEPAPSMRRDPARKSDASRASRDLRVLLATASYERDRSEHFRRSVPALRETHRCRRPRLTPTRPLPTQATAWSSDPSYHPEGASPQSVQLALSREPVRPEASLSGGPPPPALLARASFPSSPPLAPGARHRFQPNPAAGARGRATTRPLVAHSLVRRAPPPRTTRAGSSPARLAPSRARVPPPPRAPPPRGCRDVPTC